MREVQVFLFRHHFIQRVDVFGGFVADGILMTLNDQHRAEHLPYPSRRS
jgi:hypothetical protein